MLLNEMSLDTQQYCMEHTQEEPLSRSATGFGTNHDAEYYDVVRLAIAIQDETIFMTLLTGC